MTRRKNLEVVEGWRDQFCPICGEGPFVNASNHATQKHGVGLPRGQYVSESFVETHRQLWMDRVAEGLIEIPALQRRRVCRNGHAMRGRNLIVLSGGHRRCRKCYQVAWRKWYQDNLGYKAVDRNCVVCSAIFRPKRDNHIVCSRECRRVLQNKNRRRPSLELRRCVECGRFFRPVSVGHVRCSDECRGAYRRRRHQKLRVG